MWCLFFWNSWSLSLIKYYGRWYFGILFFWGTWNGLSYWNMMFVFLENIEIYNAFEGGILNYVVWEHLKWLILLKCDVYFFLKILKFEFHIMLWKVVFWNVVIWGISYSFVMFVFLLKILKFESHIMLWKVIFWMLLFGGIWKGFLTQMWCYLRWYFEILLFGVTWKGLSYSNVMFVFYENL